MTRKLVVMVFAISLSVIGCGSDDGDKKDTGAKDTGAVKDTAVDVKVVDALKVADTLVNLDVVKPDLASDLKLDVSVTTEVQPKVDGGLDAPVAADAPVSVDTVSTGGSDAGDAGTVD